MASAFKTEILPKLNFIETLFSQYGQPRKILKSHLAPVLGPLFDKNRRVWFLFDGSPINTNENWDYLILEKADSVFHLDRFEKSSTGMGENHRKEILRTLRENSEKLDGLKSNGTLGKNHYRKIYEDSELLIFRSL